MDQKPKAANYLPALAFAVSVRLLMTLYWLARYGSHWVEDDAARTTAGILAVFQSGELVPKGKFVYANGFLYQVFGTALARITGLSVQDMQLYLMPLLGLAVTVAAFAFYLKIFRNPVITALATTMLNLQGDFIYTTLRGSHEKVDYLLIFTSLLVLVLSTRWFESMRGRIALAIIYYFVILALNTNNVFFASTFTITLILSFLFWYGLVRFIQKNLIGMAWVLGSFVFSVVATILAVATLYPPELTAGEAVAQLYVKWLILFFAFLVISLLLSFFAQDRWSKDSILKQIKEAPWLLYIAVVSMVFVFIVVFVWYRPAYNVVAITGDITERIRLFMTTPISASTDLLNVVNNSWIFPGAWLWLRLYDLVVLLMAGIGWLLMVRRLRISPDQTISPGTTKYFWLLVLLPAFGLQNLLFIFSDLAGSTVNNLQIRLIPFTTIVAAPTAAWLLVEFFKWVSTRRVWVYRAVSVAFVFLALASLALGLIKGTSEPLLSNTWFFYSPPEKSGVEWLDRNIPHLTTNFGQGTPLVWAGPEFRMGRLWLEFFWGANQNIVPVFTAKRASYSYIFISPGVKLLSERFQTTIPDLAGASLIYDNGQVKIYFELPEMQK